MSLLKSTLGTVSLAALVALQGCAFGSDAAEPDGFDPEPAAPTGDDGPGGKADNGSGEGQGGLDLPLGEPTPMPDFRVPTLDDLGVEYVVTKRPITGDTKAVIDVTFPSLDAGEVERIKEAFGNVSDVRFDPTHASGYHLKDFLWPVAQAALNQNIPYAFQEFDYMPAGYGLQTNCWSTVYEALRGDPRTLMVFQNAADSVLPFFDDPRFFEDPTGEGWVELGGVGELGSWLSDASFGDVIIAKDCYSPQYCEPIHAAMVVDDGLIFERTGGATETDVYRFTDVEGFADIWFYGGRQFAVRRKAGASGLPDPRWRLSFRQGTEGFYVYLQSAPVDYEVDPGTNIRSLRAGAFGGLLKMPSVRFDDLLVGEWGEPVEQLSEIFSLAENGLIAGCAEGKFCPDDDLTRAQIVHLIGGMLQASSDGAIVIPESVDGTSFSDVSPSDWYAPRVEWAVEAGIITAASGTFRPNDPVTRAETMTMLEGAVGYFEENVSGAKVAEDARLTVDFPDVQGHWAEAHIRDMSRVCSAAYALDAGTGRFEPNTATSRADAARVFYRVQSCLEPNR